MTYNSAQFMVFLAIFFLLYFAVRGSRAKQVMILFGNLIFYRFAGGLNALAIVLAETACIYLAARMIEKIYQPFEEIKGKLDPRERTAQFADYKRKSRKIVALALVCLLGVLIYTKAGGLLNWEKEWRLQKFSPFRNYLLPLGLSYYTFSSVGYLLDVYWKKVPAQHNFGKLAACVTFFPHIVQGPISRYGKLLAQFDALPEFSYERFCFGLQRICWGLFKKMVIADRISLYTAGIYASPQAYAGSEILFAVILGVFQIYCDFSGCMDIALGISESMGISLDENFRRPFFSKSASEFWRRWHITLGTWFKDYVYMPIAVNPSFISFTTKIRRRFGKQAGQIFATAVPTMVVWILTGLWHGTGADYIVWGFYWGILIVLGTTFDRLKKKNSENRGGRRDSPDLALLQCLKVFILFSIGRMLTITGNLNGFFIMVQRIFWNFNWHAMLSGEIWQHNLSAGGLLVVVISLGVLLLVEFLQEREIAVRRSLSGQSVIIRWILFYALLFMILYFGVYGIAYSTNGFAYAQF